METKNFLFAQKRIRITTFLGLAFLTLQLGCQSFEVKSDRVEISKKPPTSASEVTPPIESSVDAPMDSTDRADTSAPKAVPKIGIILGPGLFKSFAHAGVLQEFVRAKMPIHAIVGLEWGALVAASFAANDKVHEVEWQLSKLKDTHVKSSGLFAGADAMGSASQLNSYLESVFNNLHIDSMRVPFSCSYYNLNNGGTYWIRKGLAKEQLPFCMASPPLFPPIKDVNASYDVQAAAEYLRKLGVEYVIFVNLLPEKQGLSYMSLDAKSKMHWALVQQLAYKGSAHANFTLNVLSSKLSINDFSKRREFMLLGRQAGEAAAKTLSLKLGF